MAAYQAVAGLSAGALSTLILHPVDLVKTKLQGILLLKHFSLCFWPEAYKTLADDSKSSKGQRILGRTKAVVKDVIKNAGVTGLYRGLSPNLVGSALSWSFYFACGNFFGSGTF
ncbi:mitochondrial FAD carrier protein flx1 [Entomophthora muscae]|uniref:Mitochondrial FAD carrier protein flx1 n=1 Tax=Entomophthora muscae TaxID=34485 RepID=A0ACC2T3J3_9FUNG|nr:mitochondrial FAD carrier protein flx1 [Entomophthora muscae]